MIKLSLFGKKIIMKIPIIMLTLAVSLTLCFAGENKTDKGDRTVLTIEDIENMKAANIAELLDKVPVFPRVRRAYLFAAPAKCWL